ncbi:MAG: hypothetical protein A2289_15370 [Deltaproteobacteria bacterium RIFOXYA12_FULL_58_15]|nr:MAG: hypothetical protein A2289_15370 [Deltaproteobacteria bacterium RIFOXYA12_FULL_58_15]OGR13135.1 MAG: hypothetical protein A2341_08540 [Deltaproteobacteria bacterium RIFOXYB12_FULL_58_9]
MILRSALEPQREPGRQQPLVLAQYKQPIFLCLLPAISDNAKAKAQRLHNFNQAVSTLTVGAR